jgi:hypothetical protein
VEQKAGTTKGGGRQGRGPPVPSSESRGFGSVTSLEAPEPRGHEVSRLGSLALTIPEILVSDKCILSGLFGRNGAGWGTTYRHSAFVFSNRVCLQVVVNDIAQFSYWVPMGSPAASARNDRISYAGPRSVIRFMGRGRVDAMSCGAGSW